MASSVSQIEHSPQQGLVYVKIRGTIDETFDGPSIARRLRGDVRHVVINASGVSMFTSYGIRAWTEFVGDLESRKVDLYYVECSPRFVSELNQVLDFGAHGKVLSCNAPYACPECGANRAVPLRMDRDAEVIRQRNPPPYGCAVCGGEMDFDDDPGVFFPALESHIKPQVNSDVRTFLEARLGYEEGSGRHLTVQKIVQGAVTILHMEGTLDQSLNVKSLTEGLQGDLVVDMSMVLHVQRAGVRTFSEFMTAAARHASHSWLIGCPSLIVEKAADSSLSGQVSVASIRLPFHCKSCDSTNFGTVELSGREGDDVRSGSLKERKCQTCGAKSSALVGGRLIDRIRQLPNTKVPAPVSKALKAANKRLEAARKAQLAKIVPIGESRNNKVWVAAAVGVVVMGGGLAALGATMLMKSTEAQKVGPTTEQGPTTVVAPPPDSKRPDWIASTTPNSSYCADVGKLIYCVGVSSYLESKEDAAKDGFNGALEALVHFALLNSKDERVGAQFARYSKARSSAFADLEQAQIEGASRGPASDVVRGAKARIAGLIRAQSPPGAPVQRSDWHWEEYQRESGEGTEFLAFVRLDVSEPELRALAEYYERTQEIGKAILTPAVPGLGWLVDPGDKLAFLVADTGGGPLSKAGAKRNDLIVGPADAFSSDDKLAEGLEGKTLEARRGVAYDEVAPLGP